MKLIYNAYIVNEGRSFKGYITINDDVIDGVFEGKPSTELMQMAEAIDACGGYLIPGVIDTHVHFRDPGFPAKADFESESRAAVAGGVTSVLDMPNTNPQTTSIDAWEGKMAVASAKSHCNYGFFIGATNSNLDELKRADYSKICGVKLFLGSSTGGMLVSEKPLLERIFSEVPALIMVHAEDEQIIAQNREHFRKLYGDEVPLEFHNIVRSAEACYKASAYAVQLAERTGARLHVAHVSTEKELTLFDNKPIDSKHITAETCPHYLCFSDADYKRLGARIKCNPAIKTGADREALQRALSTDRIDSIGTDHAPHLLSDKEGWLFQAASGMPSIQFSLVVMMELVERGVLTVETLVEKMCHNPARIFRIKERGFIRPGYKADLTIIDRTGKTIVTPDTILSKCGWSPYEGIEFHSAVSTTIINGKVAYSNGNVMPSAAEALQFKL